MLETTNKGIVPIDYNDLKDRVQKGAKMKELAKHYDVPVTQMKDVMKQANLRIRSFKTSKKRALLVNNEVTASTTQPISNQDGFLQDSIQEERERAVMPEPVTREQLEMNFENPQSNFEESFRESVVNENNTNEDNSIIEEIDSL